jgi:hypothetical protein
MRDANPSQDDPDYERKSYAVDVVFDLPSSTVRCQVCDHTWTVAGMTGKGAPAWWVCPNGCNG